MSYIIFGYVTYVTMKKLVDTIKKQQINNVKNEENKNEVIINEIEEENMNDDYLNDNLGQIVDHNECRAEQLAEMYDKYYIDPQLFANLIIY